jgi:hypothetical protein
MRAMCWGLLILMGYPMEMKMESCLDWTMAADSFL